MNIREFSSKELKDNKPICLMDLATVLIKYFKKIAKILRIC